MNEIFYSGPGQLVFFALHYDRILAECVVSLSFAVLCDISMRTPEGIFSSQQNWNLFVTKSYAVVIIAQSCIRVLMLSQDSGTLPPKLVFLFNTPGSAAEGFEPRQVGGPITTQE